MTPEESNNIANVVRVFIVLSIGLLIGLAASFGIPWEEVELGQTSTPNVTALATEDPLVPTLEQATAAPTVATEAPGCEILAGQNYLGEQPDDVPDSYPVYSSPSTGAGVLGIIRPGAVVQIDVVRATNDDIWSHTVDPMDGWVASAPGFYVLDYPSCASLLEPELPATPAIPTPTPGVTPTPLVVGCFAANVAPYPINVRQEASTHTPVAYQLQPNEEVEVVGKNGQWLELADGNYLAGWIDAVQLSASCEGILK